MVVQKDSNCFRLRISVEKQESRKGGLKITSHTVSGLVIRHKMLMCVAFVAVGLLSCNRKTEVEKTAAAEKEEETDVQVVSEEGERIPSIEFEETAYDFGKVRQGVDVVHTFRFQNVGENPLRITQVRSCCACISGRTATEVVNPGERGSVEIALLTAGIAGETRKGVYVHTNDPENPVVALEVVGELTVDFIVQPKRVNFGPIKIGESHTEKIYLVAQDLETVEIRNIQVPADYLSVSKTPYVGENGKGVEITITLLPRAPARGIADRIKITTNSESRPLVEISVLARFID